MEPHRRPSTYKMTQLQTALASGLIPFCLENKGRKGTYFLRCIRRIGRFQDYIAVRNRSHAFGSIISICEQSEVELGCCRHRLDKKREWCQCRSISDKDEVTHPEVPLQATNEADARGQHVDREPSLHLQSSLASIGSPCFLCIGCLVHGRMQSVN